MRRPLRATLSALTAPWRDAGITHVAAIEARGFILGGAMAVQLGAGFVPLRKKGKLPHATVRVAYALEYGVDELEMHADARQTRGPGARGGDLIATGGSAVAAVSLLRSQDAQVLGAAFVIELPALGGTAKLTEAGIRTLALMAFEGH